LLTSVVVITTILSIWLMIRYWKEIGELDKWGLVGVFVIAFIAGSSIPTPISYLLVVFAMANQPTYGIWQPALVGISGGLGAGAGGTLVFLVGRGGRRLFPEFKDLSAEEQTNSKISSRYFTKFNQWAHKRGSIVVFLMSALLNPVFAPMAIAMGALRFKAIKFFIMCTFGNLLKALVIAYIGFIGVAVIKGLWEKIIVFLGAS
jgi:membrane protein DedA with SNARE-associated domain